MFAYVCGDTVEQRIAAIIAGKQRLSDRLVDNMDPDTLAGLSLAELLQAVGV